MKTPYLSEELLSEYRQEGYAVVRGVYDKEEMEALKHDYHRLWLQRVASGRIRQDPNLPMESLYPTMHEVNREDEAMRRFMLDPRQFAIAEAVLGEEALVIGTTCFFKAPRTKALPFHQDNIDNGCVPARNVALWTSIDAADEENGGLCFIPRSHSLGLLSINAPSHPRYGLLSLPVPGSGHAARVPQPYRIVHVTAQPGDVIIFDGHTIHGSTANSTADRFRRSFAAHFTTASVTKVFANFYSLFNKHGETVPKAVNKQHGKIRPLLLPEAKMAEGEKIY
ncbi:phytanoyl-CoA dioxygenase family protein [Paenibacillus sambharensis]|uniref:Phytanoyl-CoA dioxygenase family protein n=1 Tax=Paenibacillus sambharensis TaxID=1803190 RepID=A0A2W1LPG1_9BACL|nr:phytanoyl-CoA dioxygenase family protein [Paenibacillus sambharensis]PZD96812.1 phytanoyl-CoA dioxygenase family protein [Paenibacillus sambharensis]